MNKSVSDLIINSKKRLTNSSANNALDILSFQTKNSSLVNSFSEKSEQLKTIEIKDNM